MYKTFKVGKAREHTTLSDTKDCQTSMLAEACRARTGRRPLLTSETWTRANSRKRTAIAEP